jgi:hypothetical protein
MSRRVAAVSYRFTMWDKGTWQSAKGIELKEWIDYIASHDSYQLVRAGGSWVAWEYKPGVPVLGRIYLFMNWRY